MNLKENFVLNLYKRCKRVKVKKKELENLEQIIGMIATKI